MTTLCIQLDIIIFSNLGSSTIIYSNSFEFRQVIVRDYLILMGST
jgi:hypothetical protein